MPTVHRDPATVMPGKADQGLRYPQRPLTVEGRQLMARVGDAIRKANIPVSELHISPMCRARESAEAGLFPTPSLR